MVEIVTRYRAADGKEFDTKAEAERYEVEAVPRMLAAEIIDAGAGQIIAVLLDRTANPSLADALEKAGGMIARARLAAGGSKRKRKEIGP